MDGRYPRGTFPVGGTITGAGASHSWFVADGNSSRIGSTAQRDAVLGWPPGHRVEGEQHMLLADGGGGVASDYIKSAAEKALSTGKAVAGDITFDAEGFTKVINRLQAVIDAQNERKQMSRGSTEVGFQEGKAEDWASDYYAQQTGDFDEK